MKTYTSSILIVLFFSLFFSSCNRTQRDLYPKELIGGFELLKPDQTGVDFNNDGFKDIIIVGNHYGVEVETVRYDAGYGLLLLGDGKNNFKSSEPSNSGVHIPLDSRSITSININNEKDILLVTNNNNALILLQKNK